MKTCATRTTGGRISPSCPVRQRAELGRGSRRDVSCETKSQEGSAEADPGTRTEARSPGGKSQELRLAQQIQADFLANLGHDLRTPLTSLREFISIIQDGLAGKVTDQQKEYLGIALRNADTLAEMIEHLLVLTKLQQGTFRLVPRRVSLKELLEDRVRLQGSRPKGKLVQLDVKIGEDVPDVYADPDRLLEALRNLVDNAIKYSGSEVTVTIEVEVVSDALVELRVRDTGQGMSPAMLRSIFRRFYRGGGAQKESPGGLGLGLSIVKEIVELHGGSVSVRSKIGTGTEFRLSLPRYEPRGILMASLRHAWGVTEAKGKGFGFVMAGIRRWGGALSPSKIEAVGLIREILQRNLGPEEQILPDCESGRAICFLLAVQKPAMESSIRNLERLVIERLRLKSATHVEWEKEPVWLHSADFANPEEMAEAILHQYCCIGEDLDVA